MFWEISTKPKIRIKYKLVRLKASTKSPIQNLIHEFLINMAFTMACPNFKKGMKMAFGLLRIKSEIPIPLFKFPIFKTFMNLITSKMKNFGLSFEEALNVYSSYIKYL